LRQNGYGLLWWMRKGFGWVTGFQPCSRGLPGL